MFKRLLTLSDPLFKGPAPFVSYRKKDLVISNIFCSTSDQKFLFVFEILKKELFRGRPHNSLMGPLSEKMEIVF